MRNIYLKQLWIQRQVYLLVAVYVGISVMALVVALVRASRFEAWQTSVFLSLGNRESVGIGSTVGMPCLVPL